MAADFCIACHADADAPELPDTLTKQARKFPETSFARTAAALSALPRNNKTTAVPTTNAPAVATIATRDTRTSQPP